VPPTGVTVTFDSFPVAAVTVTPAEGSALLAPLAGEIATSAPGGVGLAVAAAPPFAAGLIVSLPVPVHAVPSTASTAVAATAPSRLVTFARTRMHLLSRPLRSLRTVQR
jgi:hypothetical protein